MATSFKKSMHALLHSVYANPHPRYPKSYPRYHQVHSPGSLGNGKVKVKSFSHVTKSCLTLWDPMDYSLPSFSVHGIFQAGILEWVAISFSRGSSQPRDRTRVSHVVGRYLLSEPQGKSIIVVPEPIFSESFLISNILTHYPQQVLFCLPGKVSIFGVSKIFISKYLMSH